MGCSRYTQRGIDTQPPPVTDTAGNDDHTALASRAHPLLLVRFRCCAVFCSATSMAGSIATPMSTHADVRPSGGVSVSVATWNVLAQSYAFSHAGVDPRALSWEHRSGLLLRALEAAARPSIVCLQEVDKFEEHFRDGLHAMGYECRYTARSGLLGSGVHCPASPAEWAARNRSKRSKTDGVLIAWQRDQFALAGEEAHAVHRVDYDDLAFATSELATVRAAEAAAASSASSTSSSSAGASAGITPPDSRMLRHNVGMAVFLRPLGASAAARPLLVANTHLYWNPLHEDVKLKQMQYLMARIRTECARRLREEEGTIDTLASALQCASMSGGTGSSEAACPVSAFPFLLAGDFNSTPLSSVYHYVTRGVYDPPREPRAEEEQEEGKEGGADGQGGQSAAASSASCSAAAAVAGGGGAPCSLQPPRFICDVDLSKVAKWLRSIGIDCAHFSDAEKRATGGLSALFQRAHKEKRIILTKSAKTVERRGCPPWFLLRSQTDLETAFAHVVQHFGLAFSESLFYSRCIFCNSTFQTIPPQHYLGGVDAHGVEHQPHEPPPDLPLGFVRQGYRDEAGNLLTFQRCKNTNPQYAPCGKLFWWGYRSSEAVEKFAAKFDQILAAQRHEDQAPPSTADGVGADADAEEGAKASAAECKGCAEIGPSPALRISPERMSQLQLASRIACLGVGGAAGVGAGAGAGAGADGGDIAPLVRSARLRSAYVEASPEGSEPPFTNVTATFADCLDYVFFSGAGVDADASADAAAAGQVTAPQATEAASTGAVSVAPRWRLQVERVRPVTEGASLDMDELRKRTCSSGVAVHCAPTVTAPAAATAVAPDADAAGVAQSSQSESSSSSSSAPSVTVAAPASASPLTTCLPNLAWPSDHLMLLAHFRYHCP